MRVTRLEHFRFGTLYSLVMIQPGTSWSDTRYIIHYTQFIIQYTRYIIHYTRYIINYTRYIIHYTRFIIHYTTYTWCMVYYGILYDALFSVDGTWCTARGTRSCNGEWRSTSWILLSVVAHNVLMAQNRFLKVFFSRWRHKAGSAVLYFSWKKSGGISLGQNFEKFLRKNNCYIPAQVCCIHLARYNLVF